MNYIYYDWFCFPSCVICFNTDYSLSFAVRFDFILVVFELMKVSFESSFVLFLAVLLVFYFFSFSFSALIE